MQEKQCLTEEHSGGELSKRVAHGFQETKINKKLKRANIYIRKFSKGDTNENKVRWNIERELKKMTLLGVLIYVWNWKCDNYFQLYNMKINL